MPVLGRASHRGFVGHIVIINSEGILTHNRSVAASKGGGFFLIKNEERKILGVYMKAVEE